MISAQPAEWVTDETNPFSSRHSHKARPATPLESDTVAALRGEAQQARRLWATLVKEAADAGNRTRPPSDILRRLADRIGLAAPEAEFDADVDALTRHRGHLTTAEAAIGRLADWESRNGSVEALRAEGAALETRLQEIRHELQAVTGIQLLAGYAAKARSLRASRPNAFLEENDHEPAATVD
jgi:hypothetical protein